MEKKMTLQGLMAKARLELTPKYGEREAAAMVDEMLYRIKGWDRVQTIIRAGDEASDYVVEMTGQTVKRLLEGEPLQYIFGKAQFYGMEFTVTPDTLIPRPETAQLVDMIIDRYGEDRDLRALDLGTGSGCIAIALARNLTFPKEVTAVDISDKALEVARGNAKALKANVTFVEADMLSPYSIDKNITGKYDIIVSNPPYIANHEAKTMDDNVLKHEPHSALFVPDNDPLLFYKAIAGIAAEHLADNGTLFLEINPLYARELKNMFKDRGFDNADIEKDMQKADRFAIVNR